MRLKPCDLHDAPCWCDLTNTKNPDDNEETCKRSYNLRKAVEEMKSLKSCTGFGGN